MPERGGVRPWSRPETEFPALVPVGALHFPRTEPSEVAVTAMLAYSNGFEFFVTRLLRPDGPGFGSGDGLGPPGDEAPSYRILDFGGGVGSLHRSDSRWWTWPLPPPGRLEFICQLGAVERRVSMEAQLILDAAQRSMRVWACD